MNQYTQQLEHGVTYDWEVTVESDAGPSVQKGRITGRSDRTVGDEVFHLVDICANRMGVRSADIGITSARFNKR